MKLNSDTFNPPDSKCCNLLSPPSEPPHIGKWFSSYEYDSPEVNFSQAVEPFISRDVRLRKLKSFEEWSTGRRVEDQDFVELRQTIKRKMDETCNKNNSFNLDDNGHIHHDHNPMDADSISLPSEPPDIRNWFSSYIYESPELDTGTNFKINLFKEIQHDQHEIGIKQKRGGKQSNMGCVDELGVNKGEGFADLIKCRSHLESDDQKDLHFTDSRSLASEPPDIRTWFPSYVYESPVLCMDGELGVPVIQEIQSEKCDEGVINRNGGKAKSDINKSSSMKNETNTHEKDVLTDMTPHRNHSESDHHIGNCNAEDNSKQNDCFSIILDQIVEETQSQYGIHSDTDIIKVVDEADSSPLRNKTVSGNNEVRYPRRLLHRKNFIAKHSSLESCFREEVSAAKPVCTFSEVDLLSDKPIKNTVSLEGTIISEQVDDSTERADKENEQQDVLKNGFISTKKKRKKILPNCEKPNPLLKQQIVSADQDNFNSTKKVEGSTITGSSKRTALSCVTNMQHSTEVETNGKWKCPQRSKANLGPPLKQLRLEQWVTRG